MYDNRIKQFIQNKTVNGNFDPQYDWNHFIALSFVAADLAVAVALAVSDFFARLAAVVLFASAAAAANDDDDDDDDDEDAAAADDEEEDDEVGFRGCSLSESDSTIILSSSSSSDEFSVDDDRPAALGVTLCDRPLPFSLRDFLVALRWSKRSKCSDTDISDTKIRTLLFQSQHIKHQEK